MAKHLALVLFALSLPALAQDTTNVSCWTGNSPTPHAQRVRGGVIVSADGTKAYVSVTANVTPEGTCTNITHLYVQRPKGEYRAVYEAKAHDAYTGNGVKLLGWSGHRLLAEATEWTHKGETPIEESVIVFDEVSGDAKSYDTTGAMEDFFGGKCVATVALRGWDGPDSLLLRVSAPAKLPEGQQSCVPKVSMFAIRLSDGDVKAR